MASFMCLAVLSVPSGIFYTHAPSFAPTNSPTSAFAADQDAKYNTTDIKGLSAAQQATIFASLKADLSTTTVTSEDRIKTLDTMTSLISTVTSLDASAAAAAYEAVAETMSSAGVAALLAGKTVNEKKTQLASLITKQVIE